MLVEIKALRQARKVRADATNEAGRSTGWVGFERKMVHVYSASAALM